MSAAEIEFSGTEGQIEQWKEEIETETEKAETETEQKRDRNKSRWTSIRNNSPQDYHSQRLTYSAHRQIPWRSSADCRT